jgi:hypothetical protein
VLAEGQIGTVDAYWDMEQAGIGGMGELGYGGSTPYVMKLSNGRKYYIDDMTPHGICLVEGDSLIPVGHLAVYSPHVKKMREGGEQPDVKLPTIEMWVDRNGDHQPQADEMTSIDTMDGKPLPSPGAASGMIWIDKQDTAYLPCNGNCVLKIPSDGFSPEECPLWNLSKISYAVPCLLPSTPHMGSGNRNGLTGVRTDDQGNLYACMSATIPALTPALADSIRKLWPDLPQSQWCVYASAELAKRMHEGLGHTAECSAVKFAKYGPDGKMLWVAGRKATAQPYPGELYHFWDMAGIVNNDYVVGASEWGPMYFYTSDGFYVDSIMNDPATCRRRGRIRLAVKTSRGALRRFLR